MEQNNPPQSVGGGGGAYQQLLQQQQQQLQMFWSYQRGEIEEVNDFKNHQLPLARIKKIMKADEDVRMISAEAPIVFAKACELFILELTIRSWLHAEENKRRTLQKNDIAAAITRTDIFDFLLDIVPRDKEEEESSNSLIGSASASASASAAGIGIGIGIGIVPGPPPAPVGVPSYYYPPPPPPMGMGDPSTTAAIYVQQPPSQAWQSVWQTPDDDAPPQQGNLHNAQG